MKQFKFCLELGSLGMESEVFEFEDDVTDDEVEEELKEWVLNRLSFGAEEIE